MADAISGATLLTSANTWSVDPYALHTRNRAFVFPLTAPAASHILDWNAFCIRHAIMFTARTTAFSDGGTVPRQFTCDGDDTAPEIRVSEPPAGTLSFAIVMDDPDAPGGTFTHWLVYDIPAEGNDLEVARGKTLKNSFGRIGYGGPCPPRGDEAHRYVFTVFALDVPALSLRAGDRKQLERALQPHTLATAGFTGRYARQK